MVVWGMLPAALFDDCPLLTSAGEVHARLLEVPGAEAESCAMEAVILGALLREFSVFKQVCRMVSQSPAFCGAPLHHRYQEPGQPAAPVQASSLAQIPLRCSGTSGADGTSLVDLRDHCSVL